MPINGGMSEHLKVSRIQGASPVSRLIRIHNKRGLRPVNGAMRHDLLSRLSDLGALHLLLLSRRDSLSDSHCRHLRFLHILRDLLFQSSFKTFQLSVPCLRQIFTDFNLMCLELSLS